MNKCTRLYKYSIAIGLLSLILTGCDDFLDKDPIDKMIPTSFFRNEKELDLYANSFYQRMLPDGLSVVTRDGMGDYTSKNNSPTYIAGAYSAINEGSWNWTNLRNINFFIEKVKDSEVPTAVKNHYIGVARAFRAQFYYDKVTRYGDVPWISAPLSVDDELLYAPRDSRELVMDSVLMDLDFAAKHIRDTKDQTSSLMTRQVALALKSRICLFEGTYRKYHPEINLQAGADKFLREAADAAKKVMESKKYKLYSTGNPYKDYRTLFTSEAPVSDEVMFAIVYNKAFRRWHNITWKFNSATYGSRWGLNKQFINTYLMRDGSRFTDRPNYDEMLFVDEMQNRDPRLGQTVRSLGYKRSDGKAAPPNFGYTFTGYHILKFSLDDPRLDGVGESANSITLIRYAEVLLNYAEAKAELGEFDDKIWGETIALLRQRAGVDAAAPVSADPYLTETYFPEITDKYLLEIRRERGIELCYEGMRYNDLLRWKKGHLMEMSWKGIYVPKMDFPMDLDGNGTPDVAFVNKAPKDKVPGVYYYIIDNKTSKLTQGDHGHVTWRDNEKRQFPDKKYLHPISQKDLELNSNLTQNPGW
ncbi:MAG: RagB/SusD family nutrient uptake outer membrane protein [Porphyromonas sp.]|nr:RagB/SusD family nutrient uptake outer membrane protein [Porphyromonas sp.]